MRERKDRQGEVQGDLRAMTLTLTVALFIALLAFFIVLNAFSNHSPERAASVRNSLTASFGALGAGLSLVDTGEDGMGGASDVQEQAAAGLRSVLPDLGFASRKTAGGGRIMAVSIPKDDIEDRWPELRLRIGDVLAGGNAGGQSGGGRVLQILALNGAEGAGVLPALAEALVQEGVPPERIEIGYENRGRAVIELRFLLTGRP